MWTTKITNVIKDNKVTKQYSYSKDKVQLNFSLRTDIKTELSNFKELLDVALKDITEDLSKHQ